MVRKGKGSKKGVPMWAFITFALIVILAIVALFVYNDRGDGTYYASGVDTNNAQIVVGTNWCQDNPSKNFVRES